MRRSDPDVGCGLGRARLRNVQRLGLRAAPRKNAKEPRHATVKVQPREDGRVTLLSLGRGMEQRSPFVVLELTLTAIADMAPLVTRIRRSDRDLADQIRRAASSVALNIGEGNPSDDGDRRARFATAAGSNAEVRAALRVAVAWGYLRAEDVTPIDALLDRIAGTLYRLGARR